MKSHAITFQKHGYAVLIKTQLGILRSCSPCGSRFALAEEILFYISQSYFNSSPSYCSSQDNLPHLTRKLYVASLSHNNPGLHVLATARSAAVLSGLRSPVFVLDALQSTGSSSPSPSPTDTASGKRRGKTWKPVPVACM
jgi:hypothetical protein